MERPRYKTVQEQEDALKRQEMALASPTLTPEDIQQRIQEYAIAKAQETVPADISSAEGFYKALEAKKPGLFEPSKYEGMSTEEADAAIMAEPSIVEEPAMEQQPLPEGITPELPPKSELPIERATEEDLSKAQELKDIEELPGKPEEVSSRKPLSREDLYKQLQEKYASTREADAADLESAQKSRDVRQLAAGLGEGLADIATGGKADSGFYKGLQAQAESSIQDIQARRKQMAENLGVDEKLMGMVDNMVKVQREDELRDPNHPRVKALKAILIKQNPELVKSIQEQGGWDNMTLADVQEFLKQADTLSDRQLKERQIESTEELRKATLEERKASKKEMLDQRQQEETRRYGKQINDEAQRLGRGDPIIKKIREQDATFDEMKPLLEASKQGNQAAIAALGTRLARAMGEVGVLTDQDVVRYLGNTSWARQFSSWLKKGAVGELPEAQLQDLQAMTNMMQNIYSDKVSKQYETAAGILMKRWPSYADPATGENRPMSKEDALGLIGHPDYIDPELRKNREEQIKKEVGLKDSNEQDEKRKRLEELRAKKAMQGN